MSAALREAAARLLPLVDLTSLSDARDDDIPALCAKAMTPAGPVAAVCTWPTLIAEARAHLPAGSIALAAVVNFPAGTADAAAAVAEAEAALDAGADELDLVMPFEAWLKGERAAARDLIAAVKAAAGGRARLKVILETGALATPGNIGAASRDAIAGGADFIKTSTGKRRPGATLEAAKAMLEAIRESGGKVGFKASGGIRTTAQAVPYLALADRILGPAWAGPATFRIGASGLLDDLLAVLGHGAAAAPDRGY